MRKLVLPEKTGIGNGVLLHTVEERAKSVLIRKAPLRYLWALHGLNSIFAFQFQTLSVN